MIEYLTTGTCLDLNIALIRKVRNSGHVLPFKRLEAAVDLVAEIESQLSPDERKKLQEDNNG